MKKLLIISYNESKKEYDISYKNNIFLLRVYDFEKKYYYEDNSKIICGVYSMINDKFENFFININEDQFRFFKTFTDDMIKNITKKEFLIKYKLEEWTI
jgi:hypothetical protein